MEYTARELGQVTRTDDEPIQRFASFQRSLDDSAVPNVTVALLQRPHKVRLSASLRKA